MYIIYNNDGSIKNKDLSEYIQKGSNNVNSIFVAIEGHSTDTYSLSALATLPDGETTVALTGVVGSLDVDGTTYNGFTISLSSATTLYAGGLKLNIIATALNTQLVSYTAYLQINETGVDPDDTFELSYEQYQTLLNNFANYQVKYATANVRKYESLALATADLSNLAENQFIIVKDSNDVFIPYTKKITNDVASLVEATTPYLKLDGSTPMTGDLELNQHKLVLQGTSQQPVVVIKPNNSALDFTTNASSGSYTMDIDGFYPNIYGFKDLGKQNKKWRDIYLTGALKDGTNEIAIANIGTKAEITAETNRATTEENKKVNRSGDTMTGDLGLGNNKLGVGTGATYGYIENDNGAINIGATQLNINDSKVATETFIASNYVANNTKGVASGVATLDSNAKIPLSQIPDSVFGQLEYKGVWDATTGTSGLTAHKGDYYVCQVSGNKNPDATTYLGTYEVGDWAVYNGTAWDKVDNTDAVQSVNGMTGAVVLNATNVNYDSTYTIKEAIDNLGNTYATKQYVDNKHIIKDGLSILTTDWSLVGTIYEYELTLSSVSLEHALTINDLVDFIYKDDASAILGANARIRMNISETEEYQSTTYIKKVKFTAWSIPADTIEYSLDATRNVRSWTSEGTVIDANIQTALNGKQATLVSGTNIKTINGNSLLGSGNIVINGEPSAYLKNASVSGNTLTLTKKDDSSVEFTPSGGGGTTLYKHNCRDATFIPFIVISISNTPYTSYSAFKTDYTAGKVLLVLFENQNGIIQLNDSYNRIYHCAPSTITSQSNITLYAQPLEFSVDTVTEL